MRHQAGTSARAPTSYATSSRSCPGCISSRRRRSSSTSSPQPRSPASQWASARRGTGVLALMLRRSAPFSARCMGSRRNHHEAYSEAGVLQVAKVGRRTSRLCACSYPQISRLDLLVAEQLDRPGLVHDPALAHEVDVIGDPEREGEILLDDQDGCAAGLEAAEDASELAHRERRQPLGGLVHQENVGIADQCTPAGQHLLLAARELVAPIAQTLAQAGKEIERAREAPARAIAGPLADLQVLAHRERREDAAALRHQAHPAARDLVGGQMRDVLAAQPNATAPGWREADDRADERGLADAVAAEDRDDLTALDAQGDTLQDVALAVVGVDVLDVKHRRCRDRWRRPPDRP